MCVYILDWAGIELVLRPGRGQYSNVALGEECSPPTNGLAHTALIGPIGISLFKGRLIWCLEAEGRCWLDVRPVLVTLC